MRKRYLLSIAFAALLLGFAVWRYFAIPAPIRSMDGTTGERILEATGYTGKSLYGKQVSVRLNGVEGTLYYSGGEDISPGDVLTGSFRIILKARSGNHFNATAYDGFSVLQGKPRLRDIPAVWAQEIKNRIYSVYSGDRAALLTGILTGDRSGFSESLEHGLFTAGMTHVAAVSGLHISILAGFVSLVLRSRRRSIVITLPLVFLYIAITGFSPSAMRAGIMVTVFLLAPLLGREYSPIRVLLFALLCICSFDPYALFELSLQLSFLATLGLLLFAPRWNKALYARISCIRFPEQIKRYLTAALSSSLAALVFSLPLTAYSFGGISLISPITNTAMLWSVSVIFVLGAASLLMPFIAAVAGMFLSVFITGTEISARLPYTVLYTAQPYMLAWLLYAYILFIIFIITRRWKTPVMLAASAFVLCLALTVWYDRRFSLEVAMLDVGQGQCIILRSGGQTAMIDCGGVKAGRAAVRYLQSHGIGRVDLLLLTHYDADHINGVPALLELAEVTQIIGPELENVPSEYGIKTISESVTVSLGSSELTLIPARWIGDNNEQCVSVLVSVDDFRFLATGDLGQASERWLLRQTGWASIDVFAAGHHGSAGSTSGELLDTLEPQAVVISVGSNRYGHPSEETLGRLFDRDIAVYRTDGSGTIIIRT